jgi:hypothetical protein
MRGDTVKLIVARDQQALYDYLRWGFSAAPNVQVILDRRLWIRREGVAAVVQGSNPEQRRGPDRRRQPSMRGELLARGFVISR